MELKQLLCLATSICAFNLAVARPLTTHHYILNYENGMSYDVLIDDVTITWTGLKGDDKGHKETDLIKYKKLSDDVDVYQWDENSGAAVTTVIDHAHLTTVSTMHIDGMSLLASGTVQRP